MPMLMQKEVGKPSTPSVLGRVGINDREKAKEGYRNASVTVREQSRAM
jgi:hypothetical protein